MYALYTDTRRSVIEEHNYLQKAETKSKKGETNNQTHKQINKQTEQ